MSILYVPVVVPPQVPSRQARELSELLDRVIRDYERTHSSVTPKEIREALTLTQQKSGSADARRATAVAAGLVAALVGGVVAFASASGISFQGQVPWIGIAIVGLLVVMLFVVLLRRRP
ncbi:MAG: hypothetical protein LJF04_03550 [Gemmatimonadetes bacterium]|nr:hypothetical protein [Gemmatimonadota bacterium]